MNRRLSALLVPLALAGCATSSRVSADEGLRGRLGRNSEGLVVALSEPAHVAVFEVVPGRRVELLYPAAESDPPLLPAGRTTLESGGEPIHPYRYSDSRRSAPLLYMIASRHPLDAALIRDMRQGVLDSDQFRSEHPPTTMERLASLVVPVDQPMTDWADDVLSTRRRTRGYEPSLPFASAPGNTAGERMCGGSPSGCLTPAQAQGQGNSRPGQP